jgi:hypothetical protein
MPPESDKLLHYTELHFPAHEVSITYESGCCDFSAARFFIQEGWQLIVVNPADKPRIQKQQFQKTDRIDCKMLCNALYQKQLNAIHIPTEEQDQLRSLVRHRNSIVRQLRQIKQHIKSMLLYQGITVPDEYDNPNWSKAFQEWLYNIPWPYFPAVYSTQSKLRILKTLHPNI